MFELYTYQLLHMNEVCSMHVVRAMLVPSVIILLRVALVVMVAAK